MSVIRHCQDCGEPLDRSEIAVEVREWDALHASNNERGREVERLTRELAGAVEALRKYGWHDGVCPATLVDEPGPCECGWDDAALTHLEGQ